MKSNYKKLGDYIRQVNVINTDKSVTLLKGISSIYKCLMTSKANIVGVDFHDYKIVEKGQFAYNPNTARMGDKIPIALNEDKPCIVSKIYPVFEIIDNELLDQKYLLMWFKRPEFDRYARFKSHGSAREIFEWEQMCDVELPIPHIEKQREIVKEYQILLDRLTLNNQIIQKLEETSQTIYKQWFTDFEFPNENGKPYKSNGGGTEFNAELGSDIPRGWKVGSLNEIIDVVDGDRGTNYPTFGDMSETGFCLFLNAGNVTKIGFDFSDNTFITEAKDKELRKGKLSRNDVVLTTRGTVGNAAYYSDAIPFNDIRINSGMVILRGKNIVESAIYIYSMLKNTEMKMAIENYLSGSAQAQLPIKDLVKIPILIPANSILISFSKIAIILLRQIDILKIQNIKLNQFISILLSRLAIMES